MVLRKEVHFETNPNPLVETYSDEHYKLRQVETNIVYGASVIDTIAGYDENDVPYSRYTYEETDEKDEPIEEEGVIDNG